jgi:hypothetical protein
MVVVYMLNINITNNKIRATKILITITQKDRLVIGVK